MTSNRRAHSAFQPGFVRLAALVLAALTLCTALTLRTAQAAEWMEPYLEKVQEWGVMRGDSQGNLHEDRSITRAEFVTLVNRAFGYTDVGPNPFSDVEDNDWYAEDICIAHKAGYFQGTSPGTASPMSLVTREQAAVLLGRCLRFQGVTGAANATFTDMQDIGGWSRGLVQEAADLGIIQGYSDGSFRPNLPITRGQMACFLVRALGTLVQEPGEQTTGGVYGNLTVTTPGVKLKDTTVTGNLYLTGGVGLGDVELENVNVMGKIILTGGGEAEGGKHSVILRNVTAGSLEVDSITEQFISLEAEGLTNIGTTTVRTSAYVEDRTDDGLGLQLLNLDGVEGSKFQLAGNIKRVVNKTPESVLQIAQGVADVVTMDEKALKASVTIDNIASIRELNLDTATEVGGAGSVSHVNVNAPGSKVTMLPDTIYVRPGITGNINKVEMDNKTGNESSEDPRLLAGYPLARNVAPTSAEAVFRTNKAGTIHWALTALMDGSVGEEELMNPGSYPKIIRSGTLKATASNTDVMTKLTGLTKDGSYYISALLEDARGRRSPVKVAAFTTPDDTAPNFASGYPQAPILTTDADGEQVAQIMVMPTKNCQLYYVLLPKGSTAPTASDFRTGALPGNLGSGVLTVRKNTPTLISRINTSHLQEKTDYDLYLWLNDADNGKSSAVKKVTLTTKDITPPNIVDLGIKSYTATSVTMRFILDEPGTLGWAVVAQGASIRVNKENPTQADQIKIENIPADGKTVIRRGGPVRAAKGGTDYTFTISGLQAETTYDLYYMAKDTAGNYCIYNKSIAFPFPIRTQDGNAPTAEMWFNKPDPVNDTPKLRYAMLNSDVGIQFSEIVQGYDQDAIVGDDAPVDFQDLYNKVVQANGTAKEEAKKELASVLRKHIQLYPGTPSGNNEPTMDPIPEITANTDPKDVEELPAWIDFREAVVVKENGKTRIVFPNGTGIKMQSGSRYFFRVEAIQDTAENPNKTSALNIPAFATVSARVLVSQDPDGEVIDGRDATILVLNPKDTEFAPDSSRWDMLLWSHSTFEYDLYVRKIGEGPESWRHLGTPSARVASGARVFNSLCGNFSRKMIETGLFGMTDERQRPHLKDFIGLEFAIVPTEGGQDGAVDMELELYTGSNVQLGSIAIQQGTDSSFSQQTPLERVGEPKSFEFTIGSNQMPTVSIVTRSIKPTDSGVPFTVNLNRRGRVYYMLIPVTDGGNTDYSLLTPLYPKRVGETVQVPLDQIPTSHDDKAPLWLDPESPRPKEVSEPGALPEGVKTGNSANKFMTPTGGTATFTETGLDPSTTYILYLVAENENDRLADQVLCYTFTTTPPAPPRINIRSQDNSIKIRIDKSSNMRYVLVNSQEISKTLFGMPFRNYVDTSKGELSSEYQNYTILDAMKKPFTDSDGYASSLFDKYATQSIKNECYEALGAPDSTQNFPLDSVAMPNTPGSPQWSSPITETPLFPLIGMKDWTPYVLIVGAQPPLSENIAFQASGNYSTRTNAKLNARSDFYVDDKGIGHLTVRFNMSPCFALDETHVHPIDNCLTVSTHDPENKDGVTTDSADAKDNYIRINMVVPELLLARSWQLAAPDPNRPAHKDDIGLIMEFTTTSPRETEFDFREGLCNPDGDVVTDRNGKAVPLTITITSTKTEDGETLWDATVPQEWRP